MILHYFTREYRDLTTDAYIVTFRLANGDDLYVHTRAQPAGNGPLGWMPDAVLQVGGEP